MANTNWNKRMRERLKKMRKRNNKNKKKASIESTYSQCQEP